MYENDPSNNNGIGRLAQPPRVDPKLEIKRKKMKQTKVGLGLLLGAIGCQILAIFINIIPCLNALVALGSLGLGISAYIMLLLGARAIEKPHRTLVITSMVIIGIAVFAIIVITSITVISGLGTLIGGSGDEGINGEDLRNYIDGLRMIAFYVIVPNIMMTVAYALILFKPSKKWGKTMLGAYVGVAIIAAVAGAFISYNLTGEVVDSIDPDREYESNEMQDIQTDQAMKSWAAGLVRIPEFIIYFAVAIGAFLNVKNMERELEPKMDDRLYNLRL